MYENNKDIGWKKKNNSSNGSYDDSLIKNQINVLDNKIDEEIEEVNSQLAHNVNMLKDILINVCDFGADESGVEDSTNAFNNALKSLANGGKLLIPAGDFKISGSVIMENYNNIKIECYGNIIASSSDNHYNAFYFINCNNVTIYDLKIKSTRDRIEEPPKDHTRITNLGSNVTGIALVKCENFLINNYKTENLAYDLKIAKNSKYSENGFINKNIKLDGLNSLNTSQPIHIVGCENVKLYNLDIEVANDLGDGDHFIYADSYVNNLYIDNANLKADENFGVGFNCRTALTAMSSQSLEEYDNTQDPHNIFINNVNMLCGSFISVKADTNARINNCNFEAHTRTLSSSPRAINCNEYGNIDIKNSNFNCLSVSFIYLTGNGTINSYNNNISSNVTLVYTVSESEKSKINFINCNMSSYSGAIYYNGSDGMSISKFLNCMIYTGYTYMFSKRNENSELYVYNCTLDGVGKNNLIYNSNIEGSNTKIIGNIINGFTNVASGTDSTNLVSVNNIINDSLS